MFTIGQQMAHRLRKTTRKVSDLAFYDVTGRIARTLIDLSKEPDAMTHSRRYVDKNFPPRDWQVGELF